MRRRDILRTATLGTIATITGATFPKPAIAQNRTIKWRLASSFPTSLDTVYEGAATFAGAVTEASAGNFQVIVEGKNQIVPYEEVANGTYDALHTASYYYFARTKEPAFALGTGIPFGLNTRMMNAWMYNYDGIELLNKFYAKHGIYALPAGNTGTQMGGWFRKEIKTINDFKGMKMRIAGLGALVLQRFGLTSISIPGARLGDALRNRELDAVEWVGPYDDEKLGLDKNALYYYYPGWAEGCAMVHLFINLDKWNALPDDYKAICRLAASRTNEKMIADYDVRNPQALRRIIDNVELRSFPSSVVDNCFVASNSIYDEFSSASSDFREIYNKMRSIRREQYQWTRYSDHAYDRLMIDLLNRNRL